MEAAPTTANEDDQMEAAPVTADETEMEAAPTTANDAVMEAAPTTADGDTNLSQANIGSVCQWKARLRARTSRLKQRILRVRRVVHVRPGDIELQLYWNMSDWVALLMGNELGLSSEMLELHETLVNGTNGEDDFTPDAVRIETN